MTLSNVFLLTLPGSLVFLFVFVAIRVWQPQVSVGIATMIKKPRLQLLKYLGLGLIYYGAALSLFWVGVSTGLFSSPPTCRGLLCHSAQWLVGANDKIYAYLVGFGLYAQAALGFIMVVLVALALTARDKA